MGLKMLTLEQAIKIAEYKIKETDRFLWKCFGPLASYLTFEDNDAFNYSIIYDIETNVVYMAEVYDFAEDKHFVLPNPEFKNQYIQEAESKGIEPWSLTENIPVTMLSTVDEFVIAATLVIHGVVDSEQVELTIDIETLDFMGIAVAANKNNITISEYLSNSILGDLNVLELIQPSTKKHSVKDENEYWSLTNEGKRVFKVIRRELLDKNVEMSLNSEEDEDTIEDEQTPEKKKKTGANKK